jgi:hypothetical protein
VNRGMASKVLTRYLTARDDQGVHRWSEEDRRKASEVEKELKQLKQTIGKLASDLLRLDR